MSPFGVSASVIFGFLSLAQMESVHHPFFVCLHPVSAPFSSPSGTLVAGTGTFGCSPTVSPGHVLPLWERVVSVSSSCSSQTRNSPAHRPPITGLLSCSFSRYNICIWFLFHLCFFAGLPAH